MVTWPTHLRLPEWGLKDHILQVLPYLSFIKEFSNVKQTPCTPVCVWIVWISCVGDVSEHPKEKKLFVFAWKRKKNVNNTLNTKIWHLYGRHVLVHSSRGSSRPALGLALGSLSMGKFVMKAIELHVYYLELHYIAWVIMI